MNSDRKRASLRVRAVLWLMLGGTACACSSEEASSGQHASSDAAAPNPAATQANASNSDPGADEVPTCANAAECAAPGDDPSEPDADSQGDDEAPAQTPPPNASGTDSASSPGASNTQGPASDDSVSGPAEDDTVDGSSDSPSDDDPGPDASGSVDEAGQEPSGSDASSTQRGIRVEGRRLIVDGATFQLRGVNWNPVPKGASHPGGLDYAGFADRDIALMKAAGINAVRTYERLEDREVLDKLHAAGIYVFSTVYGWWQDEPSVVTERVNAVKDHPAILAWVLGNEWNYNKLYANDSLSLEQARDQINEAAALIKATDPEHPIASIYGEVGGIDAMVDAMPDIDLWGINAYRGIDFGDLFSKYADLSDKPLFLGEYGADAYNAEIGAYDPDSQAEATRVLTQSILDNSVGQGGPASGGFVFEWADEWWKVNGGDLSVQDTGGAAPGGGPYPDGVFNEEFWGIVDIDRNPRPAYDALVALYAE